MQEIVSFSIKVKKQFPEIVEAVKEYFDSDDWRITEEDENNKLNNPDSYAEKERYAHWKEDVIYNRQNSEIYNWGENWKMYSFEYERIEDLSEYISEKVPDSEFTGNREYYNSYSGTCEREEFSYKNGKLEVIDKSPRIAFEEELTKVEIDNGNKAKNIARIKELIAPLGDEQIEDLCSDLCVEREGDLVEDIYRTMFEDAIAWEEPIETKIDEMQEYIEDMKNEH